MPVIGGAGQSHVAQNELAALAALVGGGEGGFDAELVFSAGLAFADTFHLGRMQGVELVFVARLLPKDLLSAFLSDLEGGLQVRLSGDLALNVPDQATKPGAHFAQMAQALLVTTGVEQAAHFTPRMCRETDERLAQLDAMMLRRPVEPLYGAQDQMAVCRVSDDLSNGKTC